MKKYILIASIFVASLKMNAQVNDIPLIGNRITIGIDGGLALPGSDYGSSNAAPSPSNSNMDGYAKSGYCWDFYAGLKISKFFGVMGQYGMNMNSYNTSGLSNEFGTATTSGGYTISEYLAGPYLSITAVKIKIEIKLLAGLVSGNYPSSTFTYNGIMNTYGQTLVNSFRTGNGFGYCLGAKIKYMMIGGVLGIGIGLNYVGSDINYKGISTYDNLPSQSTSYNSSMLISIIQPTLGLSIDI